MSLKEKLEIINPSMLLDWWRSSKQIKLTPDIKILISEAYKEIVPSVYRMDLGCASCVISYLSILESYQYRVFLKS